MRGGGIAVLLTARLLRLAETYTGCIMPNVATFTLRSPMPVSAEEVYAWHAGRSRSSACSRRGKRVDDEVGERHVRHRRLPRRVPHPVLGPFKRTWVADFADFQPGRQFRDRQTEGRSRSGTTRTVHPGIGRRLRSSRTTSSTACRSALLGRLFGRGMVGGGSRPMFAYRHALTASDLRRHNLYRDRPRLTVAVTGSRGLIGSELVPFLTTGGHPVVRLVTGKEQPPFDDGTKWVNWDPRAKLDPAIFAGIDAVIHLAGDNVASGRWNARRRNGSSRAARSRRGHIAEALAALPAERSAEDVRLRVGRRLLRQSRRRGPDRGIAARRRLLPRRVPAVGGRDRTRARGRHSRDRTCASVSC